MAKIEIKILAIQEGKQVELDWDKLYWPFNESFQCYHYKPLHGEAAAEFVINKNQYLGGHWVLHEERDEKFVVSDDEWDVKNCMQGQAYWPFNESFKYYVHPIAGEAALRFVERQNQMKGGHWKLHARRNPAYSIKKAD